MQRMKKAMQSFEFRDFPATIITSCLSQISLILSGTTTSLSMFFVETTHIFCVLIFWSYGLAGFASQIYLFVAYSILVIIIYFKQFI